MTKNEVITKLWNIIDDIDTYSDIAKGDNRLYRSLVAEKQKTRWKLPINTDGYKLDLSQLTDISNQKIEQLEQMALKAPSYSERVAIQACIELIKG